MTFSDFKLNKKLQNALIEQDITVPTRIQRRAIPVILSGKDVVGVAQTGTGKTLAYLLPILRDLKYSDQRPPRVLILVPTRELVVQVAAEIEKLTTYLSIRTLSVYGGTNMNTQKQAIYDGCDILVATPGRIYDLCMTGILRLKDIQKLVIDECDEMLDLGFRPQLERILELLPSKRQNLLFSATITEDVDLLTATFFSQVEKIIAAPTGTPLKNIEQSAYNVVNFYTKFNLLSGLLEGEQAPERVFIFVKSKSLADRLHDLLEEKYPESFGVLHSNKSQNYRLRMVDEFKKGGLRGLVATDLVSRGIDIDDITHIINFDIPTQVETYMHRIGRTGRVDKSGIAISFVTEKETVYFQQVLNYMKIDITLQPLPEEIAVSEELIPEEQDIDIHDAPTLVNPKHSIGEGAKDAVSTKIRKTQNFKPRQKASKKKRKGRKKPKR